jgi:hypothetical protein
MAYSGSTAGTTLANPPRMLVAGLANTPQTTGLTTAPAASGGQGGGLWYYCSTNATTDVTASAFFTDGYYLGMRPGDMVDVVMFTSAGSSAVYGRGPIVGVSTSGASLSTGSFITSTFN